jgi:hypothetical protein
MPAVRIRTVVLVTLAIGMVACAPHVAHRSLIAPPDLLPWSQTTLDARPPVLKAHHRDGSVHVFDTWTVDEERRQVRGDGICLDARRDTIPGAFFVLDIDSVALFESNVLTRSPALAPLTTMSVLSAAMTAYCLANPKACFGSCPTFSTSEAEGWILQAEGFSASVAPALERTDVDALFRCRATGRRLTLTLTNEAMETHVIRWADLLVLARPHGSRVFALDDGTFARADLLLPPATCVGPEGDVTTLVSGFDRQERVSAPDTSDLAAREDIEIEFADVPTGHLGLVVASRQTLLTTFLFYQTLAYLGEEATSALGRLDAAAYFDQGARTAGALLGRIEVLVPDADGHWQVVGAIGETGPLATNVHLLRLPDGCLEPAGRVRLRLTRGHWRLDWIALARLAGPGEPVRCSPAVVLRDGQADEQALADLTDPSRTLVTLPGDRLELVYDLPAEGQDLEIFLESRGYYLEWLRREWQAEQDLTRAALMVARPDLALRQLAPAYATSVAGLEHDFWSSRYAR